MEREGRRKVKNHFWEASAHFLQFLFANKKDEKHKPFKIQHSEFNRLIDVLNIEH
jgi:hypothetical protein